MKNKITITVMIILVMSVVHMYGQTETNVEALLRLSKQYEAEWDAAQLRVEAYCELHNVPKFQKMEGYGSLLMVDVQDGMPVYYMLDNLGAAYTTRADDLWEGGSSGLDISGEGYDQLGVWDGGTRATHQEFTDQGPSRVTQMDGGGGTDPDHGTHDCRRS